VRKIDHAHDAEQQGQPARHQIENEAVLNGVEQLNEEEERGHERS
jgi:hypothetical protein